MNACLNSCKNMIAALWEAESIAIDEEAAARNISRQYIIRERLERKEEK